MDIKRKYSSMSTTRRQKHLSKRNQMEKGFFSVHQRPSE